MLETAFEHAPGLITASQLLAELPIALHEAIASETSTDDIWPSDLILLLCLLQEVTHENEAS